MTKRSIIAAVALATMVSTGLVAAPATHASEVTLTEPTYIAWAPGGTVAYVATKFAGHERGTTITKVDYATTPASVTDLVTMSDPANCHANVNALSITPDGTTLYAGGYSCVMKIDLTTSPVTVSSGFIGQDWVQQIAVGTNAAYAVHAEGGAVFKTTKVGGVWGSDWTALVPARHDGMRPVSRGGALTPDGATLFVTNESGGLRRINTADGAETTVAGTGPAISVAVDPNGAYALILNGSNGIQRMQLTGDSAGTITSSTFPADSNVRRISIDANGTFAYVASNSSRSILKVRTSDLTVVSRLNLGQVYPTAVTNNWAIPTDIAARPIAGSDVVLTSLTRLNTLLRLPTAPSAPTSLTAVAGDSSAEVSFTDPPNGLSAITNYEYRLDGTGSWTALSPADTTSPVTVPGLTNGTAVSIELRAVNAVGASSASNAITLTPLGTPRVPRSVSVSAGNRQVTVTFTDPISDGGSAITNYEYSIDGGGSWSTMSPARTTSPLTLTGLTNGTTYQVSIRAVNAQGPGAASTAASVTPRDPSAGGGSESSGSSSPEPTPTATPTPSPTATAEAPQAVAVPEPVAVGEGLIVVEGRATKVAVVSVAGRKWQVRGEDFTLEFVPQAPVGQLDGSFSAKAGSWVDVNGDGFAPGTLVASYLPGALADSLGQATVGADGTFTVRAKFPASLAASQYVFQVNGLATSTRVRSVNLGLRLLAADPVSRNAASKRIIFQSGTATLTPKARQTIARFAKQYGPEASTALAVPTVKRGATAQDRLLARKRAQAVVTALKQNGVRVPTKVTARPRVAADRSADRRVTLWFRFPQPVSTEGNVDAAP